jgi:flagellar biosynthesis/type III secretory pathway chaperone
VKTITIQDKVNPINPPRRTRLEDSGLQEKVSNAVDELLAVLDKDIQHIQDSLSWLNELRRLVLKRDDTALGKLLESIRAEADGYTANESKRCSIRKDLADALGCSVKQMTLSALEGALPKEEKVQVENRKTKLRALIEQLRREHLSTALLLSDCASFNNRLFKALFDLDGKETVFYRPNGAAKRQTGMNFVNMQF